jgi:hypothetical protein
MQRKEIVSVDTMKEMKSSALSIRRKLYDSRILQRSKRYGAILCSCRSILPGAEALASPEQCSIAKHDFEYFLLLLDLTIHYSVKSNQRQSNTNQKG